MAMKVRETAVQAVMTAEDPSTFVTRCVSMIHVELAGILGDRHYGLLRPADTRQKIYPRGTLIANRRQISVVSMEDCKRIAERMGIPELKSEWLGANILVAGIEGLTELPQGSRLIFPGGAGLICEGENLPCMGPGKIIESIFGVSTIQKSFVAAARRMRGIVCSVEREGAIHIGDLVRIIE